LNFFFTRNILKFNGGYLFLNQKQNRKNKKQTTTETTNKHEIPKKHKISKNAVKYA
jgi:hypothetical protein